MTHPVMDSGVRYMRHTHRLVVQDDRVWTVHEDSQPTAATGYLPIPALVMESAFGVRTVTNHPSDWRSLPDATLLALFGVRRDSSSG